MTDYESIKRDNQRRYGTDIGRIAPMLLANRYDDRTHFIFELLQNAEDALARRPDWHGSRAVNFALLEDMLRVSHCGKPFDDRDVRSICSIAESTKDGLTAIGRFGIGFKSVYAFSNRPEVHSGSDHFAIESYVWPVAVPPIDRERDETVFLLPLTEEADSADKIAKSLIQMGHGSLLFLRNIEEIAWSVNGGPSGLYLRETEELGANIRCVKLIGEQDGNPVSAETWLVFAREVRTEEAAPVRYVELAFSLGQGEARDLWSVKPVIPSPLVVFFPTVVETHLGFLVQGPYQTTPSRDNIPRDDPWNWHLVQETAQLLIQSLPWLRDNNLLNSSALQCLPINRNRFSPDRFPGRMYQSLFEVVRTALESEPLLPSFTKEYTSASKARLARTQELRGLFSPSQLGSLFGSEEELVWLTDEITQDRTPDLRDYLIQELDIAEVTPEATLRKLSKSFLEAQPDSWILEFYEFLNGQPALLRRLQELPLIRLEDGAHVTAHANGQPQAFLPSSAKTSFPTVRRTVCTSKKALEFLESLELTEPDPVDDVVRNIAPKYAGAEVHADGEEYEADIRRILQAFGTDSKAQREKLLVALRDSNFVMATDAGDESKWVSKPGELYLATERLKELFAGVKGVLLVDDTYTCLQGEAVRELLEACGATRYLQPVPATPDFNWEQLREMRRKGGCESYSREGPIKDYTLRSLENLLRVFPNLGTEARLKKGAILWEALGDVEDRFGTGTFSGVYHWTYHYPHSTKFDAAFVRELNHTAWIQHGNGDLQQPEFVFFDSLGWKPNPFLLSKICFKPPLIAALAKEAGLEPGLLDLLKKLGITSEAEARIRLGIEDEPELLDSTKAEIVTDANKPLPGNISVPALKESVPTGAAPSGHGGKGPDRVGTGAGTGVFGGGGTQPGKSGGGKSSGGSEGAGEIAATRTLESTGGRPFISYVGAHPDAEEPDPDGLGQQARLALEEQAIMLILENEPQLRRTPTNNPGYDLTEPGPVGEPIRWIEVKAMTGDLQSRPVGVSRTQFRCAQEHECAFWLYIVERAGSRNEANIVRIQDPAGRAQTFTFDRGWLNVAETITPGS